ncbi:MAG: hypothetical protein ABGY96_09150, partial [bacterium]
RQHLAILHWRKVREDNASLALQLSFIFRKYAAENLRRVFHCKHPNTKKHPPDFGQMTQSDEYAKSMSFAASTIIEDNGGGPRLSVFRINCGLSSSIC